MPQAYSLIAGNRQYAESAEISRSRRKNENEIMLKIAHDKFNYKITYTETMKRFKSLVVRKSDIY